MTPAHLLHPRSIIAVTGACFAAIAVTIVLWGAFPADAFIRNWLLSVAGPKVISVFRVLNIAGDWRGLVPGTLLLFVVFPRARPRWWLWAALMIVAPITEWTLKQVFMRPRPESLSFSFPSGHSTAAAAYFGAVIYLCGSLPPRWRNLVRVWAALMIVLVGLARVILRAHWPSDVMAGFALGLALASIASVLAAREPDEPRAT